MKSLYSFYADAARIALQSIFAHKLRAFLTLIGIIIGVASVVIVGASISGFNSYIVTTITKILGVNHFMIAQYASEGRLTDEQWERMQRRNKPIYLDDYLWLRGRCTSCKEVGAQTRANIDLQRHGKETFGTQIFGVTENMDDIEDKTIAEGR
ncbi:MAG: ABC transporter permease, partial [Blastocatellia bacterium]|nr:ABC transporter permease [Blastocatellia bacterium]